MTRTLACAALLAVLASPAAAATVRACDGVTDAVSNIVEPWELSSRTFYGGKVRVAWLDTGGEPACCSSHLLVLFQMERADEPAETVCRLIGERPGAGFAGINLKTLKSSYDPKRGLLLTFDYVAFPDNGEGTTLLPGTARVRVNLAGGAVTVE